MRRLFLLTIAAGLLLTGPARAGETKTFEPGSLVIPMDLAYQDRGMFQAYGLLFQLLRQGVAVDWVIAEDKSWHAADCDTPGDECVWDCLAEGSGVKCPYPTAGPDFFAAAEVVWDDSGQATPGDPVARHGYRGGPFVIDAAQAAAAEAIIAAWNDPTAWAAHPWAQRAVFQVVSVHRATTAFEGYVRKRMVAAPTIAVFSDGNEDIATGYLRAAGIPQSSGSEFPAGKCGPANCGPGTANPDMLTVPSVMGDMGTCDQPNPDHKNGALFTADGVPAYCQIMSMHWNVNDREDVQCGGGACPATPEQCAGVPISYHGHEVVAEVRQFLQYPVHFFAECQAVNAYENTVPNPAWPYLDDEGRDGHFLTTTGSPPACPDGQCSDGDFACVAGGCEAGASDCCLPRDAKEKGAGFLIAAAPGDNELKILHPQIPYNQLDGAFGTVGGSEPAYNLSAYLQTRYKNDREVTFITGPNGPGDQDVWMTGYVDGECSIGDDANPVSGECSKGKVSYLGGHRYPTALPLSANPDSQGTRLFLNALFEADCVTESGQPAMRLLLDGPAVLAAGTLPVEGTYSLRYSNQGPGAALDVTLALAVPASGQAIETDPTGAPTADGAGWAIGSVSGPFAPAGDPPSQGSGWARLRFDALGEYLLSARLDYRVGVTELQIGPVELRVRVAADRDADGVIDDDDPFPDDPNRCGDSDADTCDDCALGPPADPLNDGPDRDGDGICDAGDTDNDGGTDGGNGGDKAAGCGCGARDPASPVGWVWLGIFGLGIWLGLRRLGRIEAPIPPC